MSLQDYADGRDINGFHQNHPELVVRDLRAYISPVRTREVLKFRGINKWLRVRRLLIALKHRWLSRIKELEREKQMLAGSDSRKAELKGYIKALTDCRQQVRALCYSPRDVDFPEDYHKWGEVCTLPEDFPLRPSKRYFWKGERG